MGTNQRGRATRELLLDVVDDLLAERGLDVTVEEIAAAAGVSRPTVYRHVGDRGALVTAAVLRASARLAEVLTEVLGTDRPFAERLTDAIVLTVRETRDNPSIGALLAGANPATAWPDLDPEGLFLDAVHEFFRAWLVRAVEDEGVVLRADVDTTLDWLLRQALLLMLVPSALGHGDAAVRRDVETFVIPAIVR